MARQLATVLLVIAAAACARGTSSSHTDLARRIDSSLVVPLPMPVAGELRWPTAAWLNDGWVIAASLFPTGNRQIPRRALYLASSRSGLLPLPDGDFLFAYPLVRITSDGALHLFWSEGPNSQLPTGWPTTFNAVWHASYAAGKWTPAERVIRGTWLNWDSHAPQVIVDDRGRLHMLISVADSGHAEEVYHLLRDRDGWHRAGTGMYGLYPALAHISGGQLVMALVMYDGNGKSSGLYTRTSTDYGSTWNQRVRVLPTTDTTAVYHPQLRFVRDTLYLGWTSVRKEGDIWRLSKRGMRTVADTEAWLPPVSSAPMEGRIVNAMFAVHGCGDVRALAEIITGRMNQVRVIHVHESQAAIEKAFGDEFIMAPHTEQTSDRVIQIWNAVLPRTDSLRPFFREYATCR